MAGQATGAGLSCTGDAMPTTSHGAPRHPHGHDPHLGARRRSAGIHGEMITAGLFVALGTSLSLPAIVGAVVGTVLVYWLAEENAHLLGERTDGSMVPSWPSIRTAGSETWTMAASPLLPLLALVAARLAGADPLVSYNAGLLAAIALLTVFSWAAARAAGLRNWRLLGATLIAAGLGLLMIALKDLLIPQLH